MPLNIWKLPMDKRLFLTGGSGFIGSEVINVARMNGYCVRNADIKAPFLDSDREFWTNIDVRSYKTLSEEILSFQPDYIIHLASDIDVNLKTIGEYRTTIEGTRNIVRIASMLPGLRRFVHVSTQYVVKPGVQPKSETHFHPYTHYGEAKAVSEKTVREFALRDWLIVRPTIIWGPRHPSFADAIWRHIALRTYLHPNLGHPILRCYGYVRNTADQIISLLGINQAMINRHVFYLGDGIMDYDLWADSFSIGLSGRPARRVGRNSLKLLGIIGSAARLFGIKAPFDMGRYFRMTTSAEVDLSPTFEAVGLPKVPFEEGLKESLEWLRIVAPDIFSKAA